MDDLLQDLRYAIRGLLRSPGFALVAVLTVGLAIAANTALFSVVDAVLLRPLPYPDADRLVMLWQDRSARAEGEAERFSPPGFLALREMSGTLESVAAVREWEPTLTEVNEPERLVGLRVSHEYFDVLGVRPAIGRAFLPADEAPDGGGEVVLSQQLWQSRFGGDRQVVGGSITLDGEPYTVVGVVPAEFQPPGTRVALWQRIRGLEEARDAWRFRQLRVLGKLGPGVAPAEARAELNALATRLSRADAPSLARVRFSLTPLREQLVGPLRPALLVLFGAVTFVLLIACVNLANLLLARAAARGQEVAIRTALGADRARLVRQLLTESLLLTVLGGALGILIASWSLSLIPVLTPADLPQLDEVLIDRRVLGFAIAVSLVAGVATGLVPAFEASKPDLRRSLAGNTSALRASVRMRWTRAVLVVSQIAIALVLLTGAGLLLRSFVRLVAVDPGFDPENVLTAELTLPTSRYEVPDNVRFYDELLRRLAARPDVRAAGVVSTLPLTSEGRAMSFVVERRPVVMPADTPRAWYRTASAGYFRAIGTRVLRGRAFSDADLAGAPAVAIINQTMARRYWPGEDPVGARLSPEWADGSSLPIVGVVEDVRHNGLDRAPVAELYLPFAQTAAAYSSMALVIRAVGDPLRLAPAVRETIWGIDPDLSVDPIATMDQHLGRSVALPRLYLRLFAVFAASALLLATIGIYGVTAYVTNRRTQELGLRMALGARRHDVLSLVLRQALVLTLAGVGVGLAASFALSRALSALLYDTSPTDPVTLVGVVVLLSTAALLASYVPARRALRLDPMVVLRAE